MRLSSRTYWTVLATSLSCALLVALLATLHWVHESRQVLIVTPMFPAPDEVGVAIKSRLTIRFNKSLLPKTVGPSSFVLSDNRSRLVPVNVTYQGDTRIATLTPATPLLPETTYRLIVLGGSGGARDSYGKALDKDRAWQFTTGFEAASSPLAGPGGPILLVSDPKNPFSQYYAEILRNEGFNEFAVVDTSQLAVATLQNYDLVLLGEVSLSEHQASLLSDWVHEGGNLIAMRPDRMVARRFGLSADIVPGQMPIHDAYLAIDGHAETGAGLVRKPIQFHGPADKYLPSEGTVLALLYKDANTATSFPAVWMQKSVRGTVVFFSYDLARSVVYTRQGNPLWSGLERDGIPPVRPDDLFYGASSTNPQPDWVDRNEIAIPQADEQQRLLANIITIINLEKKPLPHFWYLPRGVKATIVMTGDDHGHGGTVKRFQSYLKKSLAGCSVENWGCIRATSNIFVGSISTQQADSFVRQGFEIALHVNTGCVDWPTAMVRQADGTTSPQIVRALADSLYSQQLAAFSARYPDVPAPVSDRIDCITWSDYDTLPQVEFDHGIRLETNYYYWPSKWVQNRPGLFTGSGMPMRFAKRDGSIIDVYQATTQMTDESGQDYPSTVESLLSNALGDAEYYGVFTVNMHNDQPKSQGANAVIAVAVSHQVPIVTAAQMLSWLDGRNASSFQNLTWSAGQLGFTIAVAAGGNGIQALLPVTSSEGTLTDLTVDGLEVKRQTRKIAGLNYAEFSAAPGKFVATYRPVASTSQ